MIGSVFLDRYEISDILGQGGMGIVYRAHDRLLGRDVAIKVLNKSAIGTEGRARMLREAQSAAQLNHPNIVSIYDAGESQEQPFIIMELVPGQSLHAQHPEDIPTIITIARQICIALDHAHTRRIIHRDLKPENVLIMPGNQVKLMDFGLARSIASRLTTDGSIVGSVFYLAPELALSQDFDGRADLYALGVMLYEFLTGELPFNANDALGVIYQHLHAPVVPPSARNPQIPPALEELILQLLSKRAEDRPASAREVWQKLEQIETGTAQTAERAEASPLDRIVRGRLIGRERELAQAIEVWNKAYNGDSGVLLISGEPGIGKTRLACEVASLAQVRGAHILRGDCYAEGSAPYEPIAQILEAAPEQLSLTQLSGLPELLSLAPRLRAKYPDISPNPPLEQQAEQLRMYESMVELVTLLSNQAPVLIFLDDAHWADSGTLSLLRHLARRASRLKLRLLILFTYREIELDQTRALNQILYDFNRERLGTRIKLTRLERQQTHDLLVALLNEAVSTEFLDGVYRETEGNPFFIEEVCKTLIQQGDLYQQADGWHWQEITAIRIPQSIRMAVQARIGRLSSQAQEVLRYASILGREFDFDVLLAISEFNEDQVIDALESAEHAQLIYESRQSGKLRTAVSTTFAFAHALTASTLYESLSGLRRQRLHLRAAQALERLYPDRLDELAQPLGRHYALAGEWERSAVYLLQAGDRARQLFAYPEAIDLYQQAVAILKEQEDFESAARTLMKLGLIYHATLDFQHSRQAYQEGFALWKRAGVKTPAALPPAPHPLRIAWNDPLTLDPTLAFEATSMPIINQLLVGLVSLTPDLNVSPELAHSWEMLENGKKYVFNLREDARWSDGTPVTAGDVEFAWKRVLEPSTHSRNAVLFFDIRGARDFHKGAISDPDQVGVRTIDDTTLEVELEQPTGYFLHLLTYAATYPIPRHLVQEKGNNWSRPENILTNGPFLLEAWEPDQSLTLIRNPRYFGRTNGNVERVEVSLKPEFDQFAARLAAYEADEMDVIGLGGTPGDSDRARQLHAGEYVSLPMANVTFMVFNTEEEPFADARVRRAFTHAIDRETVVEVYLRGYPIPATGGMIPAGFPGHLHDIGLPFNPEKARHLMAEAGFPNGQGFPKVDVWLPRMENYQFAEYIFDQWLEYLGVEVDWQAMEMHEIFERQMKDPPHLFMNGWLADYPDPDSFLRIAIKYQTRWKNAGYLQTVEAAQRTLNQAERLQLYRQAERQLVEEAPVIPLNYGRAHLLIKPWVRAYPLSPIQTLIFKDVIIESH